MNKILFLCLVCGAMVTASCGAGQGASGGALSGASPDSPQDLPLTSAELGSHSLRLMIAKTEPEKEIGLMFRDSLEPDMGMLFCYSSPRLMHFWMKNTRIPLDIVFFSGDLVVSESIAGMKPGVGVPDGLLPRYSSTMPAQYALELASGTIQTWGIKPGMRLSVPLPALFSE